MAAGAYDRLSATDLIFLGLEDANVSMHIGAVCLFDGEKLRDRRGRLDLPRLLAVIEGALDHNPRFRQKLTRTPLFEHPVWIDDERFNLAYHVRHTSLPKPGSTRQLKRLAGRLMSEQLDRGKPLWEMWLVEGLEDGCVALISKFHHCMIDGISGIEVLASILRAEPTHAAPKPKAWRPRAAPGGAKLFADELSRRATQPLAALRSLEAMIHEPAATVKSIGEVLSGFADAALGNLTIASDTPLNNPVGPHRRVDWLRLDLDAVKKIRRSLGGTVNDVVLAMVAGVVRSFLESRRVPLHGIEIRLSMPVNVRRDSESGRLGNRVGVMTIPLPVDEESPHQRLRRVVQSTEELKRSHQIHAIDLFARWSDLAFTGLPTEMARIAARTRAYNLSVTNVPGPQFPVYLLEAQLQQIYPMAFLFSHQALTIALVSYNGGLFWGFVADWDAIPEPHVLTGYAADELTKLSALASPAEAGSTGLGPG